MVVKTTCGAQDAKSSVRKIVPMTCVTMQLVCARLVADKAGMGPCATSSAVRIVTTTFVNKTMVCVRTDAKTDSMGRTVKCYVQHTARLRIVILLPGSAHLAVRVVTIVQIAHRFVQRVVRIPASAPLGTAMHVSRAPMEANALKFVMQIAERVVISTPRPVTVAVEMGFTTPSVIKHVPQTATLPSAILQTGAALMAVTLVSMAQCAHQLVQRRAAAMSVTKTRGPVRMVVKMATMGRRVMKLAQTNATLMPVDGTPGTVQLDAWTAITGTNAPKLAQRVA